MTGTPAASRWPLPEARFGHTFSLFAFGVSYALSTGSVPYYPTTDAHGNPALASYGFFDAWTPSFSPVPAGAYLIFDHDVGEQSETRPRTNRSLLSATWSSSQGSDIPTRMVRIWLPDYASLSPFTLYTSGSGVLMPGVSPTHHTEYDANGNVVRAGYQISAIIGVNQSFWLVRDEDGHQFNTEWLGVENVSVDYTGAFPPLLRPTWFTVGENYYSGPIYVYQSDGTVVPATSDWDSLNYLATYDADGNETYRFYYINFTATVNAYFNYSVGDASGPRDLMDGYNPPPPPPNWQYVSFTVGQNYFGSTVTVDNNGTAVEAWEDTSVECGVSTTWDDYGQEVQFYYATYQAYVDLNQGYTIPDYMDGFQPWHPAPPQGSLAIQLANWRRDHTLKLRQALHCRRRGGSLGHRKS